jgi:hypothetical protein
MTEEQKTKIDGMSRFDLVHHQRFAPSSDPLIQDHEAYEYMRKCLRELGGCNVEISKQVGWDAP